MRKILDHHRMPMIAAVLGALMSNPTGPALAQAFVPGTEDVPLMAGLEADDEAGMSFDTPSGRIVVTVATGAVASSVVREFYLKALPGLGWTMRNRIEFARSGEVLRIESEPIEGSSLKVTFTLSPAAKPR